MDRQHLPATNAMFHNERGTKIDIHNGTFIQNNQPPPGASAVHNCCDAKDGFSHLQAHVATTAFDSSQKVDAPKCHPNTRQAVQDDIMEWILPTVMRIQWMLWLNGAAGAGKSAIARSIVALCLARNIPIARFFFFRTDSTRNTLQPVVATLVHQLIQQIPDLLAIIIPTIQSDPLIFTKSLETQLQYLIFEPLRQLHCQCPLTCIVLLFDGVDECDGHENQTDLVRLIANFLSSRDLPIIAFFGSRAELQLQQAFRAHDISRSLLQLALDDHYLPDADICLFLNDKFRQIKTTHPLSHLLSETWPLPEHIEEITKKSSGQFIYASVVINFLLSPRKHPAQQLDIIRGLRPPGKLTPFAQIDALYRHIFSQVEDIDRTLFILAWHIFGITGNGPGLDYFVGMSSDNISVLLADLTSIIVYKDGHIRFLHASLPDFLLDQTRSQGYYLDKRFWCTCLSIHCFERISAGSTGVFYHLKDDYLPYAEGTTKLREHVLALELSQLHAPCSSFSDYIAAIQTVDFGDNGELYQSQLNRIARYVLERPDGYDPITISDLKTAELVLQRTHETGQELTMVNAPPTSRDSVENGEAAAGLVADANAESQHTKSKGKKRATDCDFDVEAKSSRQSLRTRPPRNTQMSSYQPATEAAWTQQERGMEKKRRG